MGPFHRLCLESGESTEYFTERSQEGFAKQWRFAGLRGGDLMKCFAAATAACLLILAFATTPAVASECDQFMLWGKELEDGSEPLNAYLNEEFDLFLAKLNAKPKNADLSPEDATVLWYKHIFRFLLYGKIRGYFRNSGEIEAYPGRGGDIGMLKYQRMSIFRHRGSFPYILPMSRNIRLGEVYLGTDKVSHMLGYGRRYFVRYFELRNKGFSDYEAKAKVIRWGMFQEMSVVGRVVDGVVSYGDLEANYQGMLFGLDMCCSDDPLLVLRDGKWVKTRDVDIMRFITPDMDESYNTAHYWLLRKKLVLPVIKEDYLHMLDSPEVQDRFAIYDTYPKSLNMQLIERWLAEKKRTPKENQSLRALQAEMAAETD